MQSRNVFCRPSVYRLARSGIPSCNRNMSMFAPTPYYPRFPSGSDFAPLIRILDDFTSRSPFDSFPSALTQRHGGQAQPIYQPRFDVKEVDNGYELRGELPGVDAKDVEVSFTDEQTLIIKGRSEREYSSGQPQAVAAAPEQPAVENNEANNDTEDAASDFSSSSYQKATVEDEDAPASAPTEQSAEAQSESSKAAVARAEAEKPQEPESRYWVSERSTGEFQRTFRFPARLNQDGVTASLKNGILNLAIPKAQAPAARRIAIE